MAATIHSNPDSSRGFTLVEILVVLVILGILAALIIPRFMNQDKKAEAAEAVSMMGAIKRAEFQYYDAQGAWLDFDDVCTTASEPLGLNFTDACGGNARWTYSVQKEGDGADDNVYIQANRTDDDYLRLNISGADRNTWNGGGEYAPDGPNWPNLKN